MKILRPIDDLESTTKEGIGVVFQRIYFDLLENERDIDDLAEELKKLVKAPENNQKLHVEVWREFNAKSMEKPKTGRPQKYAS